MSAYTDRMQRLAEKDPDGFERKHSKVAAKAYQLAERQYTDDGRVLFRRSDLRDLCRSNWPCFVAAALVAEKREKP